MRELVRYFYGLGVLALVLMVPLQMADSWLPDGRAPIVHPGVIGVATVVFAVAVGYASWLGYRYLWREGGYIDRTVARRTVGTGPKPPREPPEEG